MGLGNDITPAELYAILNSVGITVAHYEAKLDTFPYISFMELGTRYSNASGAVWRETTDIVVDHFSREEWGGESLTHLKTALLKRRVKFTTSTVWYEDVKVLHTLFSLQTAQDMEV